MPMDRFVIAPMETGLQTDVKPFLIPEDAFTQLNNAYVFRGRVTKRFGGRLMNEAFPTNVQQLYSRLRIQIGVTDGAQSFVGNAPGNIWQVGQLFSIGNEIFTVFQAGNLVPMIRTLRPLSNSNFSTTTGLVLVDFAVDSPPGTPVYFYPAQPVMGITNYQQGQVDNEATFAFDTQFAYQFINGAWASLENPPVKIWTGNDSQFFWSTNFRGIDANDYLLFTTNYNAPDLMAYWAGGPTWTNFSPAFDLAGDFINTARLIISFKGRLLLLNTVETILAGPGAGTFTYTNRCRYSADGDATSAQSFLQGPETQGAGGWADAPTKEAIVSARILKDRLIVFFEQSTWELVFTNNAVDPFLWQKINDELGAESTFSTVVFDKIVMAIGNVGIVACNGANVDRIDQKIPYDVFNIRYANNGLDRVQGIRDFYNEMVYWTYPITDENNLYPSKVLAFNYRNGSWAFFDDSITCWGYYQGQVDRTWGTTTTLWGNATQNWNAAVDQAQFRNIVAGNQEGFVFIVDDNLTVNADALSITYMNQAAPGDFQHIILTIINHNLLQEDYIYINNISGNNDFLLLNNAVWQVYQRVDSNNIIIELLAGSQLSLYNGGGTVRLVSQIDIYTKMYNFYPQAARNMRINKVDFNIDATEFGEITVDNFTSSSTLGTLAGAAATGALLGTGNLDMTPYPLVPQEANRTYLVHPVYMQANGEWIQLRLYYSPAQMFNYNISSSDFELNAMVFYASLSANRLQ